MVAISKFWCGYKMEWPSAVSVEKIPFAGGIRPLYMYLILTCDQGFFCFFFVCFFFDDEGYVGGEGV